MTDKQKLSSQGPRVSLGAKSRPASLAPLELGTKANAQVLLDFHFLVGIEHKALFILGTSTTERHPWPFQKLFVDWLKEGRSRQQLSCSQRVEGGVEVR
jgi:hypothetical protein